MFGFGKQKSEDAQTTQMPQQEGKLVKREVSPRAVAAMIAKALMPEIAKTGEVSERTRDLVFELHQLLADQKPGEPGEQPNLEEILQEVVLGQASLSDRMSAIEGKLDEIISIFNRAAAQ